MNSLRYYDTNLEIPFISANFSQNTSQWVTSFSFTLSGENEHDLFGKRLVYMLGSQSYHLLVDDKSAGKTTKGLSKTISGRSLTVLLDAPYSQRIIFQQWRNVLFSEIAAELCAAAGLSLDFQIQDALIRNYTAAKKTPIEIIKELANDARVMIQTSLDGLTFILCYQFKTTPRLLPLATVDKSYRRFFSVQETLENIENFDALFVFSELAAQTNATVEQKVISNYIRLRVFLPNWSNTPPELRHYDDDTVTVEYSGIKLIQKTFDDVQIDYGVGNIDAGAVLVSHKYYCRDLGDLTILPDGTVNTTESEHGLMRIVATVKCHEFKLTSTCCDKVRFEIFEPQNQLTTIPEIRIRDGDRYAEPVVVKYFSDSPTLIAAGTQALIILQDFEQYSLKTDHWDDLPMPCDLIEFDGGKGYCEGFSINAGITGISADIVVKIPVV
jgi:hypothetical protein